MIFNDIFYVYTMIFSIFLVIVINSLLVVLVRASSVIYILLISLENRLNGIKYSLE